MGDPLPERPRRPQRLILRNHLSPGDLLMLTAAVRDLHRCYPGHFETDVRTACPALWENNPHLVHIEDDDSSARVIDCHYPLVHHSNTAGRHFIWGFIEHLNEQLQLAIRPTEFRGDIHLSPLERNRVSIVEKLSGALVPYWVIAAGGKYDFTIKWWSTARYQSVVDHFRDRLLFVQAGEYGHHHPPLNGVLDLRGRTTTRELIHLVHHSDGVVCPVTFLMHLAAAVPPHDPRARSRPCVVVAGGREPVTWEQYPTHQFIHTIGALWCCREGGCWKSRTAPLGDGTENDLADRLCVDVVGELPRCMQLITPEEVARRIYLYLDGNFVKPLQPSEVESAARLLRKQTARARRLAVSSNIDDGKPSARGQSAADGSPIDCEVSDEPRILQLLADGEIGDAQYCALNLSLARRATCVGAMFFEDGPAVRWFVEHGIRVFRFWKVRDSRRQQLELKRVVGRTDLVHVICCHNYQHGHQFMRLFPKPSVVSLQFRAKLPLLDASIICPTEALAAMQALQNNCHVVPNGVDSNHFSFIDRPATGSSDVKLVAIGRSDKFESYYREIMTQLDQRYPGIELVVVGPPVAKSRSIRMIGIKSDVKPWLQAADILLHCPPAKTGVQDLAVLEAMSTGAVPVAADTPGTRSSIRDGEDGFLVPPGDVAAFVDRIDTLIRDAARRRTMGQAAAARIREAFSLEPMASRYGEVYKLALDKWKSTKHQLPAA